MIQKDDRWKMFCQIYSRELVPFFNTYEVERKKIMPWVLLCDIWFYLCLTIFLLPFITTIPLFKEILNESFIVVINLLHGPICFTGFITLIIAKYQKNKFKTFLKKNCMEKVLKAFGNINYVACSDLKDAYNAQVSENTINDNMIKKSLLFTSYNRREDDDLLYGNYKDVDFKILETKLIHVSRNNKKESRSTVFNGIILTFTSNKNFTGQTIVATKGDATEVSQSLWMMLVVLIVSLFYLLHDYTNFMSWIFAVLMLTSFILVIINKKFSKVEKIELEDPELAKQFVVHSDDQVESRYLLTPTFIERFKNLKTAYGTEKIKCSFFDNKVMFAIRTRKNLFEIGDLYKSLHDPKRIYTLYEELASIQAIIKHFKFDEKTGI